MPYYAMPVPNPASPKDGPHSPNGKLKVFDDGTDAGSVQ